MVLYSVMMTLWATMSYGAWGVFWIAWSSLQCSLVPAQAFVLLSSYPGDYMVQSDFLMITISSKFSSNEWIEECNYYF